MQVAPTNSADGGRQYLTTSQLRRKLGGRARSSIYLDVKHGRLPLPIKLGGRNYWIEAAVDAAMAEATAFDRHPDAPDA